MTTPQTRTAPKLSQAISRRLPKRRNESGLTTLEWLLIVAAVAGLAALAVVLVQNVVSSTSEQIAGSSARKTAAQVAGQQVMAEANRAEAAQPSSADTWSEWIVHYSDKCNRIGVTFADAEVTVQANFATSGVVPAVIAVVDIDTVNVTAALTSAGNTRAIAQCRVT